MGLSLSTDRGGSDNTTNNHSTMTSTSLSPSEDTTTIATSEHETTIGSSQDHDPTDLTPKSDGLHDKLSGVNNTLLGGQSPSSEGFKFEIFGTFVYPSRWLTPSTLYSWLGPLSSTAMVIGCVVPYIPQYVTIYKTRSCSGFSTFVCLALLLANIFRIAFWFGHRFELPLLIQSIIMIVMQILLLQLCVRIKQRNAGTSIKKKSLSNCNLKQFWRWTDLMSYLEFLSLVSLILGLSMYFLIDCKPFVEMIGYCALVIESMLGLPQVIKNYKNRSVQGMSLSMVLMWLGGDTFKTGYFVANNVPFQFWLCGLLQITIDLLILFQVCLFRQKSPTTRRWLI